MRSLSQRVLRVQKSQKKKKICYDSSSETIHIFLNFADINKVANTQMWIFYVIIHHKSCLGEVRGA